MDGMSCASSSSSSPTRTGKTVLTSSAASLARVSFFCTLSALGCGGILDVSDWYFKLLDGVVSFFSLPYLVLPPGRDGSLSRPAVLRTMARVSPRWTPMVSRYTYQTKQANDLVLVSKVKTVGLEMFDNTVHPSIREVCECTIRMVTYEDPSFLLCQGRPREGVCI